MIFFQFSGSLFSATAGPLLPDNIAFRPFNKMWKSTSHEDLRGTEEKTIQQVVSLFFTIKIRCS